MLQRTSLGHDKLSTEIFTSEAPQRATRGKLSGRLESSSGTRKESVPSLVDVS